MSKPIFLLRLGYPMHAFYDIQIFSISFFFSLFSFKQEKCCNYEVNKSGVTDTTDKVGSSDA